MNTFARQNERPPAPHAGRVGLEFGHFVFTPKGFYRSAQGCCTRLPWETDDDPPNPNGVMAQSHITLIPFSVVLVQQRPTLILVGQGQNPFRVRTRSAVVPKLAEYSNLGL